MPFDYKKEYKEFYMPKNKPSIVTVPPMNFIAVCGGGEPNTEDGAELFHVVGVFAHVVGVFAEHREVAGVFLVLFHEVDITVEKRFVAVHCFLKGRRYRVAVRIDF